MNQKPSVRSKVHQIYESVRTDEQRQLVLQHYKALREVLDKGSNADEVVFPALPRPRTQTLRGSNYRGVSRNGKKWQIMIMGRGKKNYLGKFDQDSEAAKAYDEYALMLQGRKVRFNI